ncbi:uncharacterized protein N7511_006745 [Penicillium nucicola]|uniref:uncharacterized protein n=1 Tax=Penicillium nucicola TaxID=1850975 RepID=UPI002544D6BB|nr:uncharacterized protein N7511_006745 [Penicillium nucicola]KAJ5758051.1 hypothetical protein N7511_006745 [Penicillium nucicola]
MASNSKEKKPGRITIACNACRSRKQKCSGKKPVCEQCLEFNRPCNWPEQLRRGPEKGYAEALENRLQLTESILLNLLPYVSDEQLATALPPREGNQDRSSSYVPFPRLEKRGIDSWSQLPLDTSHGIRRWQHAYTSRERVGSEGHQDVPNPKRRRVHNESSSKYKDFQPLASIPTPGLDGDFGGGFLAPSLNVSNSIEGYPALPTETTEENIPSHTISSWNGAPSSEFQRQFLW